MLFYVLLYTIINVDIIMDMNIIMNEKQVSGMSFEDGMTTAKFD